MADALSSTVGARSRELPQPASLDAMYAKLDAQRVAAIIAFWRTSAICLLLLPIVFVPTAAIIIVMVEHPAGSVLADFSAAFRLRLEAIAQPALFGSFAWILLGLFLLGRYFVRRGRQPCWDYVRSYKSQVLQSVCDMHFPGLSFDPSGYVGYDEFDATRLFAYGSDEYLSEDYFSGRVGETDVAFAEVTAKRERKRWHDGRRKTYYDTFFRGLVFVADFHKHFHSTTRLVPRDAKLAKVRGQNPVTLEDPEFEETFATVSTDQVDVRYVLSTSMARRFVDLSRRFPRMRALFKDEKLLLALPSKRDKFEPSLSNLTR